MKTMGKICLGFFFGFIALAIAGIIVLSSSGSLQNICRQFVAFAESHGNYFFEVDWDFEEHVNFSETKAFTIDGIRVITINADASQVDISQSADADKVSVDYKSGSKWGGSYNELKTGEQGGALFIEATAEKGWPRIGNHAPTSRLKIVIPQGYQGDLSLETTVGKIRLSAMDLKEGALSFDLDAGTLDLDGVKAKNLTLDADAATINLSSVAFSGAAEVTLDAGAIKSEGFTAASSARLRRRSSFFISGDYGRHQHKIGPVLGGFDHSQRSARPPGDAAEGFCERPNQLERRCSPDNEGRKVHH